ncbi:MAG: hypothetical protein JNL61_13935 [Rhizobiaceae bacterium]|nr:hypothetical protein [Rhizobiaceae bacterium]
MPVPGTWAYLDRLDVAAGSGVSVHVSAPADHEIELVRLGRNAVIDPAQSLDADREEAELLTSVARRASPQMITPGSYIHVAGAPVPAGEVSMGLWLRIWKIPVVDMAQVAWQGLITDIDYPDAARFGLVVDHLGRIGVYAGDGGAFRHQWLHMSRPALVGRVGNWAHIAASISAGSVKIYLDGALLDAFELAVPVAAVGAAARLRIGAMAEHGAADDFLEGDVCAPFVGGFVLDEAGAARLFADQGRSSPGRLSLGAMHAAWPLDEEIGDQVRDDSGNGRDGTIVNHGTWMVGGPAFDAARREPLRYDPEKDPDHGHGLRFCSDDLMDAGWPEAARFELPADAASGIYAVRVRLAGQKAADAVVTPFVVTRRKPRREKSVAVLCATNTWHAYGRRHPMAQPVYGLTSSLYSAHLNGRPFFHLGMRLPIPWSQPYAFESKRSTHTRSTHLVRTERFMEAWLASEGYPYEMITDFDLTEEPGLLNDFAALAIVGHSEYWTDEARQGVLDYLDGGGKVLGLSGDTLSVRVTFDETRSVMECRKIVFEDDPRWLGPGLWGESWHSHDRQPGGSYRRLGKPAWDVLGMSFKGMIDDGTSNAFASYEVLRPDHFLFHRPDEVEIGPDGRIGVRSLNGLGGASGYEFDANLDRTGMGPAPLPGVTTLASATGQRNIEWLGDPNHGADLIYWQRPSGGTVVNFGSIGAAGALPVDAAFAGLVRNTLAHFGVPRAGGEGA